MIEIDVKPDELNAGMIISKVLFSGSGVLLLNKGVVLDAGMIKSLKRYYMLDPPNSGIFVQVER